MYISKILIIYALQLLNLLKYLSIIFILMLGFWKSSESEREIRSLKCCYFISFLGRTRLEPLAVIVLSVFMGSISIQLVAESVQAIVRMSQNNQEAPNVNDLALGIMASVIGKNYI